MGASDPTDLILGFSGRNEYRIRGDVADISRQGAISRPASLDALPQNLLVDLHRSALIVIDMQNDFCSEGGVMAAVGADLAGAQALYAPINRVIAAARSQSVPVIWVNWGIRADRANLSPGTRYTFCDKKGFAGLGEPLPPSGARTEPYRLLVQGEWGSAIVDALDERESDIHVDKHRVSGFWDTPLDSILRNLDVTTLFFAGVNSDHCVLATLMDANFKGYDTVMIEDCTATTSPEFCHRAAIHNVRFCFGFTATSQGFVDGLRPA